MALTAGNKFAVAKLMTTKFPLCAALMQLSSTLAKRNQRLKLKWTPRDQNFEADELSNGITHRFRPENEVKVDSILRELTIFNKMVKYGRGLYDEIKQVKDERKRRRDSPVVPATRTRNALRFIGI